MRLTFVQEDRMVMIDGEGFEFEADELEVVENLHAIQMYQDGYVEVEWVDDRGFAIGNSDGINGLPNGFIDTLITKHAEKKMQLEDSPDEIDQPELPDEEVEV